jgi:hypothetical protein
VPGSVTAEKGPLALHPMPSGFLVAALSAELSQGRADAGKLPSTVGRLAVYLFEVCLFGTHPTEPLVSSGGRGLCQPAAGNHPSTLPIKPFPENRFLSFILRPPLRNVCYR